MFSADKCRGGRESGTDERLILHHQLAMSILLYLYVMLSEFYHTYCIRTKFVVHYDDARPGHGSMPGMVRTPVTGLHMSSN